MAGIWTMGEILVEIMRPRAGMALDEVGEFMGPFPSGAPAIFADTAARLGHSAGIIGGVGEDDFGRCVIDRLEKDGVDCRFVLREHSASTAAAFVTYFADGSRKFIFHIDGTPAVRAPAPEIAEDLQADLFHIMGCSLMANPGFREQILITMQTFRDRRAKVSFDPNVRPELLGGRPLADVIGPVMESCSILLPGERELFLLTGSVDLETAVRAVFNNYPLETVVLKRGKAGCVVYTRTGDRVTVPAFAVEEVDPTGAGDCFDAGFLCALLEGHSMEECATVASACGALNAAAFGPMEGQISRSSVDALVRSRKR